MKIPIPILCLSLLFTPLTTIAQTTDIDWPCIQVLVPEIVPAVVWPEEITEEIQGKWKTNPTIAKLAEKLGDLEQFTDEDAESIRQFAESIPETDRLEQLNVLTDGIVAVTNKQRAFTCVHDPAGYGWSDESPFRGHVSRLAAETDRLFEVCWYQRPSDSRWTLITIS